MRTLALAIVAALFCVTSTGCATLVTGAGPNQTVKIESSPRGARIFVDEEYKGLTPLGVAMTRADDHVVRLEMDGYRPITRDLKAGYNPWHLGNLVLGGLVGITVDLVDGSFLWLGGGVSEKLARVQPTDDMFAPTRLASSRLDSPRHNSEIPRTGQLSPGQKGTGHESTGATPQSRTAPLVADASVARRPAVRPAERATDRPLAGDGVEPSRLPPRRQAAPAGR